MRSAGVGSGEESVRGMMFGVGGDSVTRQQPAGFSSFCTAASMEECAA